MSPGYVSPCAEWALVFHDLWAQVAIAALLTREHRRWLAYGGLEGPGTGDI